MNDDEKTINQPADPESTHSETGVEDSSTASENARRPEPDVQGNGNESSTPGRGATGPRTTAGKRKSSRNALKMGIYSKALLLPGESRAEYEALLNGLLEDYQPKRTIDRVDVVSLARVIWKQRRVQRAENAEIMSTIELKSSEFIRDQIREAWDRSRAGETSGGMLRYKSNPFVVHEAIQILTTFRNLFEKSGFQKNEDPWRLRKLYGLDHDNKTPQGLFSTYQVYEKLATASQTKSQDADPPENLKKEMLGLLDEELQHLKILEMFDWCENDHRSKYRAITALVPSQDANDRFLRCDAHLSRDFDRIVARLERRLGRHRG